MHLMKGKFSNFSTLHGTLQIKEGKGVKEQKERRDYCEAITPSVKRYPS